MSSGLDKSWITGSRGPQYEKGVQKFIDYAKSAGRVYEGKLRCPCVKCSNDKYQLVMVAKVHCIKFGFLRGYTTWIFHGESYDPPTSSQASDTSNMELVPYTNSEGPSNSKKRRGHTMLTKQVANLTSKKLKVKVNKFNQPCVGSIANLRNWIGVVARRSIPYHFQDWRNVDETMKKDLLKEVMVKFNLGPNAACERWILSTANECWKRGKIKFRRTYVDDVSLEDAMKNKPIEYGEKEWFDLIQVWKSDAYTRKKQIGKGARANQVFDHALGAKSIAEVAAETGLEGYALWKHCHTKKNGEPTNDEVETIINDVEEYIANEDSADTADDLEHLKTLYLQELVGRNHPGRVKGVGKGVTPKMFFTNEVDNSKRVDVAKVESRLRKTIEQEVEERIQARAREAVLKEMEEKMAKEKEERDKQMEESVSRLMASHTKAWVTRFRHVTATVMGTDNAAYVFADSMLSASFPHESDGDGGDDGDDGDEGPSSASQNQ